MNRLYKIILIVTALLILSIGTAFGVTYPINSTMLPVDIGQESQTNINNVTQEPIDTVEPITTTTGPTDRPTDTVTKSIEKTVRPIETEPKIPKETLKSPGFDIILIIGALSMIYMFMKRR